MIAFYEGKLDVLGRLMTLLMALNSALARHLIRNLKFPVGLLSIATRTFLWEKRLAEKCRRLDRPKDYELCGWSFVVEGYPRECGRSATWSNFGAA